MQYINIITLIMIQTFNSFIDESKQVGILYHFTNLEYFQGMLESGKIIGTADYLDDYKSKFISATRYHNLDWIDRSIRITLDGDKISENYKIKPIHYFNTEDKTDHRHKGMDFKKYKKIIVNQFEERIHAQELSLSKYAIQVDCVLKYEIPNKRLLSTELKDPVEAARLISELSNSRGIPFNFVESYERY